MHALTITLKKVLGTHHHLLTLRARHFFPQRDFSLSPRPLTLRKQLKGEWWIPGHTLPSDFHKWLCELKLCSLWAKSLRNKQTTKKKKNPSKIQSIQVLEKRNVFVQTWWWFTASPLWNSWWTVFRQSNIRTMERFLEPPSTAIWKGSFWEKKWSLSLKCAHPRRRDRFVPVWPALLKTRQVPRWRSQGRAEARLSGFLHALVYPEPSTGLVAAFMFS